MGFISIVQDLTNLRVLLVKMTHGSTDRLGDQSRELPPGRLAPVFILKIFTCTTWSRNNNNLWLNLYDVSVEFSWKGHFPHLRHLTLTAGDIEYRGFQSVSPVSISTFCRSHEPLSHFGHCARCYRKLPLRKEEAPKVMTLILLHGSIAEKSPNVPTHFLFIITADRLCDTIELPRSHPLRWHRSIYSRTESDVLHLNRSDDVAWVTRKRIV